MKSEGVTDGRGVCSGPLPAKEWGEEGSCQVCVPLLTEDSTPPSCGQLPPCELGALTQLSGGRRPTGDGSPRQRSP